MNSESSHKSLLELWIVFLSRAVYWSLYVLRGHCVRAVFEWVSRSSFTRSQARAYILFMCMHLVYSTQWCVYFLLCVQRVWMCVSVLISLVLNLPVSRTKYTLSLSPHNTHKCVCDMWIHWFWRIVNIDVQVWWKQQKENIYTLHSILSFHSSSTISFLCLSLSLSLSLFVKVNFNWLIDKVWLTRTPFIRSSCEKLCQVKERRKQITVTVEKMIDRRTLWTLQSCHFSLFFFLFFSLHRSFTTTVISYFTHIQCPSIHLSVFLKKTKRIV